VGVVALLIQRLGSNVLPASSQGGLVVVSVPDGEGRAATGEIAQLLKNRLTKGRLESLSKNQDSTVLSYAFRARSQDTLLALQDELREKSAGSTINIFFDRSAVT
jgi:hypothetical protein